MLYNYYIYIKIYINPETCYLKKTKRTKENKCTHHIDTLKLLLLWSSVDLIRLVLIMKWSYYWVTTILFCFQIVCIVHATKTKIYCKYQYNEGMYNINEHWQKYMYNLKFIEHGI